MIRLCSMLVLSSAALTACAGLPPTTHPLFIARPADSPAAGIAQPTVTVEMNNVLLQVPASAVTGCALSGNYVREGSQVVVRLIQAPGNTACGGPGGTFVTRIGPLPPGSYEVNVTLDGKPLVNAGRANIS